MPGVLNFNKLDKDFEKMFNDWVKLFNSCPIIEKDRKDLAEHIQEKVNPRITHFRDNFDKYVNHIIYKSKLHKSHKLKILSGWEQFMYQIQTGDVGGEFSNVNIFPDRFWYQDYLRRKIMFVENYRTSSSTSRGRSGSPSPPTKRQRISTSKSISTGGNKTRRKKKRLTKKKRLKNKRLKKKRSPSRTRRYYR